MRRPNRSIEVFDISLMAVVTKAMGAFLVLMLLLMPYYSSGPVGEQNAAALTQTIADAQKELDLAVQKLTQSKPDPKEIARLLDEVLKRLREAQELIARLKRDNDALNGQVKRLEENLDQAEKDNEALEKELAEQKQTLVVAQLVNWDCLDVRIELALLPRQSDYTIRSGAKVKHVLNLQTPTSGDLSTTTDDAVLARYKDQQGVSPGHGLRYNQSTVYARLTEGELNVLVLLLRDKALKKIDGMDSYALKKASKNCNAIVGIQYIKPSDRQLLAFYTKEWQTTSNGYGMALWEVTAKNGEVTLNAPTAETEKWLKDHVDGAAKEAETKQPSDNRAAALKTVDGWTLPADKPKCLAMTREASQLQTNTKASDNQSRVAMAAIIADCNAGQFASALQKAKAEMRRVLK